jgi:N-acetylglucosamine-6-sulfatase
MQGERKMKKLTAAVLCLLFLFANYVSANPVQPVSKRQTATRPNIIFILADDLDATTSPVWEAMTQTKTLLRDKGVNFTNAFAPTPICCPARASILTGKYGHNTGILTNGGEFGGWQTFVNNGNEQRTVAVKLQNAGYKTALMGKYLNGIEAEPLHIPAGWTEWYAFVDNLSYLGYNYKMNENGTIVQYGNTDADYNTDVLRDKAVDFINRAETTDAQPFFLYLAPTAPHLPLPPARRHQNHPFRNAFSPRTPNYNEADISDKASWLQISGDERQRNVNIWNDIDYRYRMGSLYALDEMIAAIHQTLVARGELQNTIIVFTSDNGYNLGAHRLIHKMAPYEESIRVPLVVAGANIQPRVENRITAEIDFAPTFLRLAGLPIPNDTSGLDFMDGLSLVPLLRGQTPANWRSDLILQYITGGAAGDTQLPLGTGILGGTAQEIPTYKAVRTANHTYIEWYDDERFQYLQEPELYDLLRDPFQLNNLLATPQGRLENRELVNQLKARMNQLANCKGDGCR